MLADYVRTGTYQKAIYDNSIDFRDKVVLDVGTGTGILAFFAIQAGAKMVYAVDASNSVKVAKALSLSNKYQDRITIIKGRIEEIELPEKVDVIISEPIGFLLVHERMLESYVVARDRFLKPGGLMMPTTGKFSTSHPPLTISTSPPQRRLHHSVSLQRRHSLQRAVGARGLLGRA